MHEKIATLFRKCCFCLVAVTAIAVLVGCSSTNKDSNSAASASNSSSSASSEATASAAATTAPAKNGFDPSTNVTVEVAGFQFQIPQYFAANAEQSDDNKSTSYFAETGASAAMIMTRTMTTEGKSSQLYQSKDGFFRGFMKSIEKAQLASSKEITINGIPAVLASITGEIKERPLLVQIAFFINDDASEMGAIALYQTDKTQYDYTSDFLKVLDSGQKVINSSPSQAASSVTPELKNFLDSYEAFVDEYISFMSSYDQSSASVESLSKLSKYMQKYSEFMSAVEKYDSNSMSAADAAYYLEVTSRCAQKLLSASL